jgi:2-keto-3-deoxy-6-phosphogluconate aldolase
LAALQQSKSPVPRATGVIEHLATNFTGEFLPGAGTVLDPETARAGIRQGDERAASPGTSMPVGMASVENRHGLRRAVAVGMGGNLRAGAKTDDCDSISKLARQFVGKTKRCASNEHVEAVDV